MRRLTPLLLAAAGALLAACSINQKVAPVESAEIQTLCVESNSDVFMEEFQPTLVRLIEARGVETRVYSGARPEDCHHTAIYTANWRWDFAMYLSYARIEIIENHRSVGVAEYDASLGGLNLGKFGTTEDKIRPLIEELFPV